MAQLKNILGTGISGKLNQVVFYQRNGKTYVRSLPIRKNKICSPAQLLNKQRFAAMQQYAKLFKYVIIPQIWNHASKTLTGKQLFVKTNKSAFDSEGNIPDLKMVQLSTGKLHLPQDITINRIAEEPTKVHVSWLPDTESGEMAYWDELMVVASGEGIYSNIQSTGIKRGETGGSFEPPGLETPISHLFLFFGSLDKRHYSPSICFEVNAN